MEASLVHTRPDTFKIDPFNGIFFKRWQEKVFSIIDVVNLGHILTDPKPEDGSHLLPTWETGNKQVRHAILTKVLLPEPKKRKLGPKTFDAMFIGYAENSAAYSKYEDNTCVVICLYVDDMLIFGTNLEVMCETKKFLGSKFDMKDLGEAEVILGIKITRTPNGLKLSQEHYVEKILRKFEHFDCKPVSTPYDPSSQLKKNREHSVVQIEYAQIIGSLMYLMNCTIPDIVYAVGFSDANWILDSDEMKSTSGYVFILGGNAVS
ncbi:Retrovirus-related Pol polyprotein from transposon TNT 1-94 [Vitis vinifera]|uniref:Retrovirus-related Pol polyprotein from transposon TNT 1-94 n=1 Tax=Vitis vinifera TaxID=29760 RepID=A0A438HUE2_VITVI|nr:Retrovirus-related Pol polyprotein from transposon TNT 1-94 [Vitis vinifera]